MSYFLNQTLPVYFMLLPLGIAAVLAVKYYQLQSAFSKVKANYQVQLREAQCRLDEAITSEKEISKSFQKQAARILGLESELAKYKLAIRQADDNLNDVRLTWSAKSEKDAEIIRNLNAQAVEREALIVQLNKQIAELKLTEQFNESILASDEITQNQLRNEITQLQSKIELCEKAHIETQTDLDGERYYLDAVAEAYKLIYEIVKRNSRTRKQYDGAMKSIGEKRAFAMGNLNWSILALADKNTKQKAQAENSYNPTTFSHVGETINEKLLEMNMPIEEVANQTCLTLDYLYKLINCQVDITTIAAKEIERVTGMSADFLMRFQAKYDEVMTNNVVHDILGVARVFEADQSESVNNRHGKLIRISA